MDARTARILNALDPVSVTFLLQLLERSATEADLVASCDDATQPTTNRRLHRLRDAGLVAQESGKRRAPRRRWSALHVDETHALLTTLFALSDAVEARERAQREAAKRKLKRARAAHLGLRRIDNRP